MIYTGGVGIGSGFVSRAMCRKKHVKVNNYKIDWSHLAQTAISTNL